LLPIESLTKLAQKKPVARNVANHLHESHHRHSFNVLDQRDASLPHA